MWWIYHPGFSQPLLDMRAGKGQQKGDKGLPVTEYLLRAASPRQKSAEVC